MTAIHLETDVPILLRDGTLTRANVWRPADGQPAPAILLRTPYRKEVEEITALCDPRQAVPAGFAVVCQDVRGRGRSQGSFQPFVQEIADGFDTVEAVARAEWCTGEVAMCGSSYVGATQWLAAVARPAALRAIAPAFSARRYDEGWTYRDGVLELAFVTSWIAGILAEPERLWLDDVERAYADLDGVRGLADWAELWLSQAPGAPYWQTIAVQSAGVPILAVGGWYDIFLDATLRAFAEDRHTHSRLVIGPWAHDDQLSHLVGERNLGAAGSADEFCFLSRQLEFFSSVLHDREPSLPRVTAYVLGGRRWLELDGWPPPGAGVRVFELGGGGRCDFDVVRPVPSYGGRALRVGTAGGPGWGPVDQRAVAERTDVVVLSLAPLGEPVLLSGPVAVVLDGDSAGGEAVDWVCTLCLEAPGGALFNLCEGIRRLPPGASTVEVELGDVCAELEAGDRLSVLVAGSSYPRWQPVAAPTRQIVRGGRLRVTVGA